MLWVAWFPLFWRTALSLLRNEDGYEITPAPREVRGLQQLEKQMLIGVHGPRLVSYFNFGHEYCGHKWLSAGKEMNEP